VVETESEVDDALTRCRHFNDHLQDMSNDYANIDASADVPGFNIAKVIIGEADISNKLTVLRGRVTTAYIGKLGNPEPLDVPSRWRLIMLDLLREIRRRSYGQDSSYDVIRLKPNPHETNAGSPVGSAGYVAKLIGACCTSRHDDWDHTFELTERIGNEIAVPRPATLCFMVSFRAGPTAKFQPEWEYRGSGQYQANRKVQGAWARARQVFMGPFSGNLLLEDLWARLLAGIKLLPGLSHDATSDDELAAKFYSLMHYIYESDISGYDQSVTREVQAALRDALIDIFPELEGGITAWYELEGQPVATPNWFAPPDPYGDARVVRNGITIVGSAGGTHSGSKMTSVVGTLICLCTTLYALEKLGASNPLAAWLRGDYMILALGDDILLSQESKLDRDAWADAWADLKFKTTLLPGCRFLMQHRTPDGPLQVAARVVQNSLFPEYYHIGKHATAMNALAFAARTERGIPQFLQDRVFSTLLSADWIARSKTRSYDELQYYANVTMEPEIKLALEAKASGDSLSRYRRDAEHSPSSARILEYALKIVPSLLDQSYSLDRSLSMAANVARSLKDSEKIRLASRLFKIVMDGGSPQDQLLQAIPIINQANPGFQKALRITNEEVNDV
jgi:hypothetical protein